MQINTIITLVQAYNQKSDTQLIQLAYEFASEAHKGQKRLNGEEYIQHCLGTAFHLAKVQMDDATIIAGLLHDVVDETSETLDIVRKEFGDEVAMLVEGVSKLGKLKYRGMERYAENLRKMFVSIASDIRIIIIKFADRLHNLQTLEALEPEKQIRIAHEVMEIYAPIADRLGMGYIKGELEDHAFQYMYPEAYRLMCEQVLPHFEKKKTYLAEIHNRAQEALKEVDIAPILIESRVKHLYSIYRKLEKKGSFALDGIYDLVALRIIVGSIAECYATLGAIHQYWKPLSNRFKDYIAKPKPNNYRSLHTTVFCDDGEIVEFQIRSHEMDYEAKYGIAAHWSYDESGKTSQALTKNLDWLQEILRIQQQTGDNPEEYLNSLKIDVFQNRIFVFTPKGDVINLPEQSTPVDFAYHIHTDVGRRCSGARVNNILSSLNTTLQSGDVVEIITEKNRKKPSPDWLTFVKTHLAKTRIREQIRGESPKRQ
jgi:GTP diphosphokinase / guanosine-3',5'-bis(diphosphate) 3'-diphosphatase